MDIKEFLKSKYSILLLVLLIYSFTIRIINLSEYDFGSAWDEGYYAMATRNILYDSSNIIYGRYLPDSDLLIGKPPGFFWIGAIFIKIFGVNEINYRLVSVIAGTLSVYIFYLLIKFLFDRKTAFISSVIFASFPLHVAFSRVFQMDVIMLLYVLLTSYFLIIGVCKKNDKLLWISAFLIALNILTKLWGGILSLFGVYFWLYIKQRGNKNMRTFFIKSIVAFFIGFIIFLLWPTVLWLTSKNYTGFHGGCKIAGGCNIWENILIYSVGFNSLSRLDVILNNIGCSGILNKAENYL